MRQGSCDKTSPSISYGCTKKLPPTSFNLHHPTCLALDSRRLRSTVYCDYALSCAPVHCSNLPEASSSDRTGVAPVTLVQSIVSPP
jgi:hypothetical protein